MITTLLICMLGPAQQASSSYTLDIFYRSTWVGDSKTTIERTKLRGEPAIKTTRTTQITKSFGRVKPMFTELIQYQTEEAVPIELRYTYSSGLEAQEMTAVWKNNEITVVRRGFGKSGAYEPVQEKVAIDGAKRVGGDPLDSVLFGSVAKSSSENLSLNFESRKLEETQIRYVGEAKLGKDKTPVLEYHVMRKSAILYRVYLDAETELPLRIESIDGLLMVPKKKGGM